MTDPLKEELLQVLEGIWKSDDFKLSDTMRTRSLRLELLMRALSVVMTDDERARLNGLPAGCRMREGAKILSKENLVCGEYVWIGENAILDASGGLEIGSHTSIGLSVYLWSHTSPLTNLTMQNYSGSPLIERKRTKIGSGVFIGGPSVIFPGVSIGNKVIISPLSVVNKDIPDYSVVAGNPARIIKTISEEYIEEETARVLSQKLESLP
jgi:acetyltransferase-like isoleucine patch superfamily enzyme